MKGLGTLLNTLAMIVGSIIGLFIKKGINKNVLDSLMKAVGVSVMFIGISGALTGLLKTDGSSVVSQGSMLMIISLTLGTIIGEALKIEDRLEGLGGYIQSKISPKNDSKFVEGFVTATLITCVGAMAIVGSINDGLSGDFSMLAAKSLLDGIICIILSSTLGIGVLFSAFMVMLYQGALTMLASVISPILSQTLILNLSYIGSVLIFCIGINQVFGKKIKTGNMLPALLIPIIYEIIVSFTK